ncbi:protein translation factor SUI1 homolog [Pyrus x bretschneideri]|uniref:protein translation factor SUI1 homolog n=1 Tax=Pyrus x bretschneideri TaxID=225117 RepID=UPI0020309EB6|nr:protein translation factor SUI1 homolog [Pyrus x bretschneideri]
MSDTGSVLWFLHREMVIETLVSDLCTIPILDPFAEANSEDSGAGTEEYVHIRIQQRNGQNDKIIDLLGWSLQVLQAGIVQEHIKIHGF